MTGTITVSKVTQLHRVAVIEMSADGGATFDDALVAACSQARIIVIDCLALSELPPEYGEVLGTAQQGLTPQGGHLIVVNAPESSITDLRFLGIDSATTTDLRFDPPQRSGFVWQDEGTSSCA